MKECGLSIPTPLSSLKPAMNMNIASIAQALCESLTLCRSAGISDENYFEPLSRNVAFPACPNSKSRSCESTTTLRNFPSSIWQKTRACQWRRHKISRSCSDKPNTSKKPTIKAEAGWKNYDFIGLVRIPEKQ